MQFGHISFSSQIMMSYVTWKFELELKNESINKKAEELIKLLNFVDGSEAEIHFLIWN